MCHLARDPETGDRITGRGTKGDEAAIQGRETVALGMVREVH